MINLNRPTADDAMLHAHSRAVAAPKRQPKPAVRHPVHAMCLAMSEVYQHEPLTAEGLRAADYHEWQARKCKKCGQHGEYACAACGLQTLHDAMAFKPELQKALDAVGEHVGKTGADGWKTKNPPVPGVYVAAVTCAVQNRDADVQRAILDHRAYWSGGHWTITCTSAERARALRSEGSVSPDPISWLRLIEADAPAAEAVDYRWMRVRRVPLDQRGGLWHYKSSDETIISRVDDAEPMRDEDWNLSGLVRRALPNVKEGDPYNEAAYAGVAG